MSAILTSSFSNPYALFKKDCFANFFTINHFPTLLPNTWGVPASSAQRLPIFSTGTPLRTHSNARNPFLFNRLLHSSLFTHIFLSLPFSPLHQRERRLPPNTETSCQFLPSCIDSSGTTPHLSKGGRSQKMSDEKSIQGGDRFPPTRWSVIDAARSSDEAERTRAMDTLCAAYWKPVYKYIRLRWNRPAEDAQDLTQGFFVQLIERGLLEKFDPAKSRLRTYLRVCVDSFVVNEDKSAKRLKRGGSISHVALDFASAEEELGGNVMDPAKIPSPESLEEFFEKEWIRGLFELAVEDLRKHCEANERERTFRLFEEYDLAGDETISYDKLAAEYGIAVTDVTNALAWARREFRRGALDRLREICGSEEEFQREARAVFGWEAK